MADDRLEALYRRYGRLIYARCRRILGDAALAEDAVQEVFLRAFRHLDRALDDGEALAWVYRISTNHCLDLLRRRTVRSEEPEAPAHAGPHPEQALADRDLVRRLLRHAPEKLRAPALLYHLDGMEQEQIAKLLKISRRTVINRLAEFQERAQKFVSWNRR